MLVSPVQPENAPQPISVTLSGIVMVFNLAQPVNAPPPISVTLSGIVMLVSPVQTENAYRPISVTAFPAIVFGITTSVCVPLKPVIVIVPVSLVTYSKSLAGVTPAA